MKSLIVNADDFGLTEGLSNGIISAHKYGILTSTSIIANGKGFQYAVEQAKAHPELGVGIHLTLVEERPVLDRSKIPTLVDSQGLFPKYYPMFFKQLLLRKINLADVERELRAQVEKCLAAGLTLSHMDSHQHIHILPPIFRILVRLAIDYKIHSIRLPNEKARLSQAKTLSRYVQSRALFSMAALDRMWLRKKKIFSSHFTQGLLMSGNLDEEKLAEILKQLSDGVTELACHPGEEDAALLRDYGWWNFHWKVELSALTSERIKRLVRDLSIELTNYAKLSRRTVDEPMGGRPRTIAG